jgi:hypothetical protein
MGNVDDYREFCWEKLSLGRLRSWKNKIKTDLSETVLRVRDGW